MTIYPYAKLCWANDVYLTKHAIEKNINIALKARNNKELTANSKFTIEKEALSVY